jgi:uncharacterized protein (DUF983 family)
MKKGSWGYAILKSKCPRCHEGDLWKTKRSYSKGFSDMHERCSNCGLKYTIEQGFWYGAMYISYAFGVIITVTVVLTLTAVGDYTVYQKTGVAVAFLIAFAPPVFRYSRNIWGNLFTHFEQKYLQEQKNKK